MDDAVRPPIRIVIASSRPISDKRARKNINAFLAEYAVRPSEPDATIRTRLETMSKALRAEQVEAKGED